MREIKKQLTNKGVTMGKIETKSRSEKEKKIKEKTIKMEEFTCMGYRIYRFNKVKNFLFSNSGKFSDGQFGHTRQRMLIL
jgi:hypothetical protein